MLITLAGLVRALANIRCNVCGGTMTSTGRGYRCNKCGNSR